MKRFLKTALCLASLCAVVSAGATTALKEMTAGGVVYGYQDPATCAIWNKTANSAGSTMYYTVADPNATFVAAAWPSRQTFGGFADWRLPTMDEFHSLRAAVGRNALAFGTPFATQTMVNGVPVMAQFASTVNQQFWTSKVVSANVYGYVVDNDGESPHSYQGGAKLYVWVVRYETCAAALASPFLPAK